jgi:hypothetical protein
VVVVVAGPVVVPGDCVEVIAATVVLLPSTAPASIIATAPRACPLCETAKALELLPALVTVVVIAVLLLFVGTIAPAVVEVMVAFAVAVKEVDAAVVVVGSNCSCGGTGAPKGTHCGKALIASKLPMLKLSAVALKRTTGRYVKARVKRSVGDDGSNTVAEDTNGTTIHDTRRSANM